MTEVIGQEAEGDGRSREVAVRLMRMALPLLDRAGEGVAAARLQAALDALVQNQVIEPMPVEDDRTLTIVVPRLVHSGGN